jgi:hypothetical protein
MSITSEQWRKYIPLRLPWTVCIRDKVWARFSKTATMLGGKHPDLALPINAAQKHLLDDVDGTRTLCEISQNNGK